MPIFWSLDLERMLIYQDFFLWKSAILYSIKLPFDVQAAEKILHVIYCPMTQSWKLTICPSGIWGFRKGTEREILYVSPPKFENPTTFLLNQHHYCKFGYYSFLFPRSKYSIRRAPCLSKIQQQWKIGNHLIENFMNKQELEDISMSSVVEVLGGGGVKVKTLWEGHKIW